MTSSEIRASFLDFFREKGHTIVPSSSLLPDAPNLLFTNAGMNQFVPIFLGQTPCPYKPARAADTQKCIRAGGKHNDLEDVGFDTYHHTFFEMLGNWSFGDYFKKEAIAWAWELVVGRWKFPASRIYATVYQPGPGDPASFDQEAYDHWAAVFTAAGLDPSIHIVNGNKKDNFWMMGDTGPCGPCSELHVDLTPGPRDLPLERQQAGRELVNKGDARCIEIWNLVFIQFNANPDGTFGPLPAKHVDTGMGFERVVSMIQGTRGLTDFSEKVKISNYETDVFRPIFDELEKLTGKKYGSTLPASAQNETEQEKIDVAFRVIADHIRTLSFSIADGIVPGHGDRGAVIKSILRRAVRYGYQFLGQRTPFLARLIDTLGSTMGPVFPELIAKSEFIKATLTQDEEIFFRTIERGIANNDAIVLAKKLISGAAERLISLPNNNETEASKIVYDVFRGAGQMPGDRDVLRRTLSADEWQFFSAGERFSISTPNSFWVIERDEVQKLKDLAQNTRSDSHCLSGNAAFLLHDTYGFPLDLTQLMARERGLTVDVTEFKRLMEEQKARSRAAQQKSVIEVLVDEFEESFENQIKFVGYDPKKLLKTSVLSVKEGSKRFLPKETQLYPAMGGQVSDDGWVEYKGKKYPIAELHKVKHRYLIDLNESAPFADNDEIILHLDLPRRAKIEAHHSGTHLLNWALRKVLGNTITQKGSYVGPDRLRFDFSHGAAMTPVELAEVERLVNEKIDADVPVKWEERPYAEVKGDPSILQFFGDKYGDMVRVVSIGDFSKELCGGTHVRQSGKVGYFKILHEAAIAAGIRRIEAASGEALRAHLEELLRKQEEQVAAARRAAGDKENALASTVARSATATTEILPELWQRYKDREMLLHDMAAQRAQHEKETMKQQEAAYQKQAASEAAELTSESSDLGEIPYLVHVVDYQPAAYLPFLADALKAHWQGVVVLVSIDQGKVALLCTVSPDYTKKIQAGKIIQAIAPLVGGKGGGRPELAQGGGTNPDGVAAALEKAEALIHAI
jgi:alanyl-tRNA synthetase